MENETLTKEQIDSLVKTGKINPESSNDEKESTKEEEITTENKEKNKENKNKENE